MTTKEESHEKMALIGVVAGAAHAGAASLSWDWLLAVPALLPTPWCSALPTGPLRPDQNRLWPRIDMRKYLMEQRLHVMVVAPTEHPNEVK